MTSTNTTPTTITLGVDPSVEREAELERQLTLARAESRRAEQALMESELRHRFALKSAQLGSWELSSTSLLFETCARHDEIFGVREHRGEWPYQELLAHIAPEDRDAVDRKLRRALKNASDVSFACRVRRQDGAVRWIEVHGSQLPGTHDADARRMLGVIADITERKKAERALLDSEARYRIMGETLPYGVWLADPEGRSEYLSASFLELVGRPLEDMRGLGWTEVIDPDDVKNTVDAWQRCVATGTKWERELRVTARDGSWRTVLARGLPVRDERGRVSCWVGIHLDITERKDMELDLIDSRAALERQMRRLEEVDQRKDEFLAILGHELRNPLAAIGNGVRLLQRGAGDEESFRWTRTMLADQVRQLTRIVDDLLDVTRITRGKVQLHKTRLSLKAMVQDALAASRPVLEERRHRVEIDLDESELFLDADQTRLEQVIVNLLTNAAKYTPPEGLIEVSLHKDGDSARVVVKDSGVGLEAESLQRIFEPFAQIRGSSIAGGGLGIGLTIVRQLVELHGGTIRVASDGLGHGSTFTVTLPLARGVRGERVEPGPEGMPDFGCALRVLVVDDNCDAAVALGMLLSACRCVVETVYTGGAALEKAKSFLPDVVLCDIGLPDVTGFEVAQALRDDARCRGCMLVAVTGFGHDDVAGRVRESGFDLHLLKPVDPDVLFDLLAGAKKTVLSG